MYAFVRLFAELSQGIRLSKSSLIQDRQLAVIVFDHMVELAINNAVRYSFEFQSAKDNHKKIKIADQKAILYKYDGILKHAKKIGYLTEDDVALISFNHNIRNELYHKGNDNIENTSLAISVYLYFIATHKKLLIKQNSMLLRIGGEGYKYIDFGQGLPSIEVSSINSEQYINDTFDYLIGTFPNWEKFQNLAYEYFEKRFTFIEEGIQLIQELRKTYSFYEALISAGYKDTMPLFYEYYQVGRKPKTLDSILIISAFLRVHEGEINELSTLRERDKISKALFKKFKYGLTQRYPYMIKLDRKRKTNEKLKAASIGAAVKTFAGLANDIELLYRDVKFAAMILDGHNQFTFDLYRGK